MKRTYLLPNAICRLARRGYQGAAAALALGKGIAIFRGGGANFCTGATALGGIVGTGVSTGFLTALLAVGQEQLVP
jgi:hypothetical protein